MDLVPQLAMLMFVGIVGGLTALKLKTPLIIGYIIGGALLALFFSFGEEEIHAIEDLAEVGVALLLFAIGIEFSLDKLMNVKKYALYGGVIQIILTIVLGVIVFPIFGFSSYESLFLGSVFSLSSTAVVIKVLDDIGQIETNASQIIIGWLILQDIAVVLLIILLGNFVLGSVDFLQLFESLLKSFILIAIALIIGRKVIPRILSSISGMGSKEIMVVIAFGFCILVAYFAQVLVGSFTLGAFLAGIMISESFLHHEIFSEIKPLQNIFSLFFFIIIGTLFSFNYLFDNILMIIGMLFFVMTTKAIIILGINLFFKMHIRSSIEVAIGLAQVGEFAFLSANIGLDNGWINQDLNSLIVSVTILSLLMSPIMITKSDQIYEAVREFVRKRWPRIHRKLFMVPEESQILDDKKLQNHIIICGFGRVGKYIAIAIKRMRYKHILIDLDSTLIEEAKEHNVNALYGDATSEEILLQAGLENARAVIIALPKETDTIQIANKVKSINPDVKIILRRHFNKLDIEQNKQVSIVEPEFEAALKILEKILPYLGKKDRKILRWLRDQKEMLF